MGWNKRPGLTLCLGALATLLSAALALASLWALERKTL